MKKTLTVTALAIMGLVACSGSTEPTTPDAAPTTVVETQSVTAAPAESSSSSEAVSPSATASEQASGTESATATDSPTDAPVGGVPGSLEDAIAAHDAALGVVDGVVIEQDLDDDKRSWEVDVLAGDTVHEVKVAISDGTAQITETDEADDDDRAAAAAQTTLSQAMTAALEHTSGTLDDISWDDNHWEVEVDVDGDDVELMVDSRTGQVTSD